VFGEDFTDDSDDAVLPTRPHRRAAESDSDDDDDDDDDSAPTPGKPAASRPSAGPAETPGRRKGRLSRRRGGAGDDDEDDDQGDSGDDEVRPAARRARSSRRAGGGGGVAAPRRKNALDDMDDDDFIDDAGAARRRRRGGEDDDVVRTEGGWHVDAEDMEVRPGEEEAELDDEDRRPKTAFEEAEARLKANRRQRKKEADPVEVDAEVVEFLSQMMAAHVEDVEAYSEGRPALAKLRMLPAVRLMFVRHEYRESLLNNMVLAVLKCWLEPMSDSALPNIEIRTVLLDILGTFRVDTGWVGLLENSQGLGKIIHYLSIKDDHPPNQLAAKKLLKAWARPFYNANDDFHDLRKDYELGQGVAEIRRDARRSLSKLEARNARRLDLLRSSVGREEGEEQVKVMASIPEKTPFLFTKMADSEVQERVTKNRGAKRKQAGGSSGIARRFNSLKKARKTGAARGAANPSINGR
jgi:transcription factor SPN1